MPRPRPVLLLLFLVGLAGGLVAACGGSAPDVRPASVGTNARDLLRDTFARGDRVRSGVIDAKLAVHGARAVDLRLSGPFAAAGEGRLPRFQYTVALQGPRRDVEAGLTWTGEKAFVGFQGTQYAVPAALGRELEAGYEEAAKGRGSGLAALGIDPARWLRTVRTQGELEVAGTPTVRLTGAPDVPRVMADLAALSGRARALGLPGAGGSAPTPAERRRAVRAVKALSVQVYTGKADRLLRRLSVQADLRDRATGKRARMDLDVTFRGVNESQDVVAPQGARPLSELLPRLHALGGVGP